MYLSRRVSKHAFKTARGRKGSAVCLLAGEEPARGRHSFICVEQRGSCEEQMFVPNVLPSAADERKLFIIVTEDILVVILESFFPSFLIPVRLRSLPKQEVIAQPGLWLRLGGRLEQRHQERDGVHGTSRVLLRASCVEGNPDRQLVLFFLFLITLKFLSRRLQDIFLIKLQVCLFFSLLLCLHGISRAGFKVLCSAAL